MENNSNTYIPFAELNPPQLFLLYLAISAVLDPLNAWPATAAQLRADVSRIWDQQRFTPSDLLDASLAERLEPHLLRNLSTHEVPRRHPLRVRNRRPS
jgi:hypothetical protein